MRYDGYETVHYVASAEDSTSLTGSYVLFLYEDSDHMLWIGTDACLNLFDRATESFTCVLEYRTAPWVGRHRIIEDSEGLLWVGTVDGLFAIERRTKNIVVRYTHDESDETSLSTDDVRSIFEDSDGTLWVGTTRGLNRFNRQLRSFERYLPELKGPVSPFSDYLSDSSDREADLGLGIFDIVEGIDQELWLATSCGIQLFDKSRKSFFLKNLENGNPADNQPCERIDYLYVDERSIWVNPGGSFLRYDLDLQRLVQSVTGANSQLLVDRSGVIWIATRAGLKKINPAAPFFHSIPPDPDITQRARSIYVDRAGILWIGVQRRILNQFDRSKETYKQFSFDEKALESLIPGDARKSIEDGKGGLWVGIYWDALYHLDPSTGDFTRYAPISGDGFSLSANTFNDLVIDHDGELWVATWDGGLNRFNSESGTFSHYRYVEGDVHSLASDRIISATIDQSGILWLGLDKGLCKFDKSVERFDCFNSPSLTNDIIEDQSGRIWAATNNGLQQIERTTGRSESFTTADGLSHDITQTLIEDNDGHIWIGTSNGLSRYDPESGTFLSYSTEDGLLSNRIEENSATRSPDGELFFRTLEGGIIAFHPDSILANNRPPEVVLTNFQVNGNDVGIGKESPLKTSIVQSEQITLSYDQRDFSFAYAALHYERSDLNQYSYKLEGYDKAWTAPGYERKASYTNMNPGDYVFRVKASNRDGIWNEEGTSIAITILPPWWQTTWAYFVYGLLFIAGVIAVDRFHRKRLIAKERLRAEREKAKAIETTNNELQRALKHLTETQDQLIHTEKMASLGQLTAGIAHEIKNPLNFVNNFSTLSVGMIDELKTWIEEKGGMEEPEVRELVETLKMNATKINDHGQRADGIIRSMLEHSRTGRGERRAVDINKLVDEYVNLAYHGVRAREDRFEGQLNRNFDNTLGEVDIYPQEIGRVLINLLDNAFYTVNEKRLSVNGGYEPQVSVITKKAGDYVEMRIRDNGLGIPKDIREKIFEPFFTTKPTGSGTGLGLSLSHDIVVKGHGGQLLVESEDGDGATFIVRLPAKNRQE